MNEFNEINEFITKISDFDYYNFDIDGINKRVSEYTFGLDKIIPWDKLNFVFSGGLLYDAIIDRKDVFNSYSDIDLFFYGTPESKLDSFKQILLNLNSYDYKYLVGINKSVVYIFIQGIPRIIQLIFTNKMSPEEIINTFDLTHIQSYWNGEKLYCRNITLSQFVTRKTEANFKTKPSRLIKYLRRGIDTTDLLYSDYDFVLDAKQFFNLNKYQKQVEFYKNTNNLLKEENLELGISDLQEFEANLSKLFWCKIITKNKLDFIKKSNNTDEIDNIDEFNLIDFIGDIENYTKLNLSGKFEQKPYELDLHDDTFIFKKQGFLNRLTYETQTNIYIQCEVIKKCNLFKQIMYLEIIKPRVIDYLIGLIDDLEQDLINYLNPLNKQDFDYIYTHHFQNSTTYPKIKPNTDFIFNTFGLVCKCDFTQEDYDKYSQGDKLYILFNISIYSINNIGNELMFGWKLKPYLIEKNNFL